MCTVMGNHKAAVGQRSRQAMGSSKGAWKVEQKEKVLALPGYMCASQS